MQSMDNPANPAITLADPIDPSETAQLRRDSVQSGDDLRKQTKDILRQKTALSPNDLKEMSPDKILDIFREIQAYQVELEMQNEELRQNQEKLDATRARYFEFFDVAPVGYCTLSKSGLIEEVNCTAATVLGVTQGELINHSIAKFILEEDRDVYFLQQKLLIETGVPQVCDVRMIKNEGPFFWAHLNIAIFNNENGVSMIGFVFTDISEQKLATMTMKDSEQFFRKLFQRHTMVCLFLDADDGRIIEANDAAVQFYGWPIEVLKQMRIQQINVLPPEIVQTEMDKAACAERNFFEFSHRRADGSVKQVEVFSNKIKIGKKDFLFSIVHDITERKQEEKRFRECEDRFRSLFQDAPAVAVQGYKPDGTILYWNRASESVYGYSTQEAVGRNLINLIIPPEMRQEVEMAIRQMAETGQPIPPSELSLMRKDGSRVPVFSSHTVVQESGRVQEIFCIDIDLTQHKQFEESLRQSEVHLHNINKELKEQNRELKALWEKSRLLTNELNAANEKLMLKTEELEKANIQLINERNLLQSVMEAIPVGLAITDTKGGTIMANDAYDQLWGGPRPETESIDDYSAYKAWWADTGKVVNPKEWASARAVQNGVTTVGQMMRIRRFDGSDAFVINSASPMYKEGEGIVGSVVVIQDISELKRIELALHESEQRLRLFIEHAPAALAMFDRDMRYLYVSNRWLSDYGLETRDLRGMAHYEIFPEIPAQWKDFHRRGLDGEVLQSESDCFVRVDGSVQWMRWEIRPWYRVSGDIGGIVIFTEDITKRKHAEDMLQSLNKELEHKVEQRTLELQKTQKEYMHIEKLSAIGKLSASIAHEFNNPLQGIMSVLIGVQARAMLDEEDKVLLSEAIEECNRIRDLIRSLQEFNCPSTGTKALFNVQNALDSLILLHKNDFKKKRISVVRDYAQQLPQIEVVPDQIKQVFLNLLTNAADACHRSGGEITIKTWQADEQCIAVSIKDTGIGIQPSDMDSIFQPFFTTKPALKGSGLGLSISYGIIENHQGKVRVESQPGEGATFTVLLPIKAAADPSLSMQR